MEQVISTCEQKLGKLNCSENLIDEARANLRFLLKDCASYIIQSIRLDSPILFIGFLSSLKEEINRYGISEERFIFILKELCNCLKNKCGKFIEKDISKIIDISAKFLTSSNYEKNIDNLDAYKQYREEYLRLALKGERDKAFEFIIELLRNDITIKEIYLKILRDALYQAGFMWNSGKITLGEQHYITATTQLIMLKMYPYVITGNHKGVSIVGACAKGELHEMGIRMICDLLELDGYDTYYIGSVSSLDRLIEYAVRKKARIILLSVSWDENIKNLKEMIFNLKKNETLKEIKIIVGGRPFVINENLYRELGADGYAIDTEDIKSVLGES